MSEGGNAARGERLISLTPPDHKNPIEVRLVPSWSALSMIETRTGQSLLALLRMMTMSDVNLTRTVIILGECMRAGPQAKALTEDELGAAVVNAGVDAFHTDCLELISSAFSETRESAGNADAADDASPSPAAAPST